LGGLRGLIMSHEEGDLPAEMLLVETEGFRAVAAVVQQGFEFHFRCLLGFGPPKSSTIFEVLNGAANDFATCLKNIKALISYSKVATNRILVLP
jgi:hypothetical protein